MRDKIVSYLMEKLMDYIKDLIETGEWKILADSLLDKLEVKYADEETWMQIIGVVRELAAIPDND